MTSVRSPFGPGKWGAVAAFGFLFLIVGTIAVENGRGDRAWRREKARLSAQGELFTLADLTPRPVPPERNLFQDPLIRALAYEREAGRQALATARIGRLAPFHIPDFANDLSAVREHYRTQKFLPDPSSADPATDVLAALQPAAGLLDALRLATHERPEAVLDSLGPTELPTFDVPRLYEVGRMLAFRARVQVALTHNADAHANLVAVLRLADGIRKGAKNLLAVLVAEALYRETAPAIEAGVRQHGWSDAQLAMLQDLFLAREPLAGFREALRIERAVLLAPADRPGDPIADSDRPWWLIRGWARQGYVGASLSLTRSIEAIDPAAHRLWLDRLPRPPAKIAGIPTPHSFSAWLTRRVSFSVAGLAPQFGQSVNDATRILAVMGLERHFLAHRGYPATLAGLIPCYLPRLPIDVFDGQAFGYRQVSAEEYELSCLTADGRTRVTWSPSRTP